MLRHGQKAHLVGVTGTRGIGTKTQRVLDSIDVAPIPHGQEITVLLTIDATALPQEIRFRPPITNIIWVDLLAFSTTGFAAADFLALKFESRDVGNPFIGAHFATNVDATRGDIIIPTAATTTALGDILRIRTFRLGEGSLDRMRLVGIRNQAGTDVLGTTINLYLRVKQKTKEYV